ncbi:MAG: Gfo/Idh/MocA family oxidoreductase [Lentisphaerae bacterium]|nr:Gfo/Idh/MocA family oxidoreductase [Lentisphaerota bacterium]
MTDKKIRIGFAGVGNMGQCAHLKNYAVLEDCEVAAIAEIKSDQAKKVAVRYGVSKVYNEADEMLAKEKLDGIVASQQFVRHGIIVPKLLKAGIPIFTEKPLAASIETGEKIVEAVKKSGTWLMVGYHKRSDPATIYAKAEIERLKKTGELGEIRYIRIIMPSGDWIAGGRDDIIRGNDPVPQLEKDPPDRDMDEDTRKAYLMFVNYYIHQINLMRHLLGEPYKISYADPSGVMLAGSSESGIACVIEMTPYETTIDWQESALVCFKHGYVKLELPAPLALNRPGRVAIFKDPGNGEIPQTIVPQLPWEHAMRRQAKNFIAAIKGKIKPLTGAEEALEDLKLARDYIRLWKKA